MDIEMRGRDKDGEADEALTNHILRGLPPEDFAAVRAHLSAVDMAVRDGVYEPNTPILHVYFPVAGVYSIVNTLEEGGTIEVATVGEEGFVGVPVLLGATTTPLEAFCQVAGRCMRMGTSRFRQLAESNPALRARLMRYTQGLFTQVGQTAACNRAHDVVQRCSRWLLMTQDRMHRDQFVLTPEFLGQMLGTGREGVFEATGILQQRGLISYAGAVVTVKSREGLERTTCECYAIIRREYEKLLA